MTTVNNVPAELATLGNVLLESGWVLNGSKYTFNRFVITVSYVYREGTVSVVNTDIDSEIAAFRGEHVLTGVAQVFRQLRPKIFSGLADRLVPAE